MKKYWVSLTTFVLALSVNAADDVKVTVTGDRVSLRAGPELNSVLLGQAMEGDSFVLLDESNPEWFGIFPPDRVDLWVGSEFVRDDKVVPERLNVRSGPSPSHSVVGVINKGQELTIRGEKAGWLRIAPPKGTVIWISRQYAEIVDTGKLPGAAVIVEPEEAKIIQTRSQPEMNAVMTAAAGVNGLPKVLLPDPNKTQGNELMVSGIVRPAGALLSKLTDPDNEEVTVCYVRGNAEQMSELDGKAVTILGRAYRALALDLPFIRPVKIQLEK